jgi:hypothetical protein
MLRAAFCKDLEKVERDCVRNGRSLYERMGAGGPLILRAHDATLAMPGVG